MSELHKDGHFVSKYCKDEKCKICGKSATHKLGEEIFDDDPNPSHHNLTCYVCCEHFRFIMIDNLKPNANEFSQKCKECKSYPECELWKIFDMKNFLCFR